MEDNNNKFTAMRKWNFYCLGFMLVALYSCAQAPEVQSKPAAELKPAAESKLAAELKPAAESKPSVTKAEKFVGGSNIMKVQLVVLGEDQDARSTIEPKVQSKLRWGHFVLLSLARKKFMENMRKSRVQALKEGLILLNRKNMALGFAI